MNMSNAAGVELDSRERKGGGGKEIKLSFAIFSKIQY